MERVTNTIELKIAIRQLEIEQSQHKELLKYEFNQAIVQLSPKNLIKSQINQLITQPNVIENIVDTTISLATGFISKKIIIGSSKSIIKNLLGSIAQVGITDLVARNPNKIRHLGQLIYERWTKKP